jgi:hypothetical protein
MISDHPLHKFGEEIMSDEEFDFDFTKDKIAQIHAEFDQFRAAVIEVAQTVCDYREKLKKSRHFSKEEQFMLVMEYQSAVLGAILRGDLGGTPDEFGP